MPVHSRLFRRRRLKLSERDIDKKKHRLYEKPVSKIFSCILDIYGV